MVESSMRPRSTSRSPYNFFVLLFLLHANLFHRNLFLWLAGIVPAMADGCPVRPLIKPCMCTQGSKGLEIVCEGVQLDGLKEVFENLQTTGDTIMYLKMKNNHMPTFPSYLLNGVSIRHLMAHKCNMVTIEQFAFFGIRDTIESLDLSQNKFKEIPSALQGLSSLVSLNLNYNQIEWIHDGAFQGLTALLRLSLFGNKITKIDLQAFVGVGANLTRVNLGGNQLTAMPSESLKTLKSLQRLQIHENRIHILQRQDLAALKHLEHLDVLNLAHNLLKHLEPNVFFDMKALNSIDLEANQLRDIDDMAFNGIQDTLEWLKLDSNKLDRIPATALAGIKNLRELDLKNNQIQEIRNDSFRPYGNSIKFLYLQKNRIHSIENNSFDHLSSLEWLYLNSNRLRRLPRHLFQNILDDGNLTILDLHDNPLDCSCEIHWYKEWIETNEKHQMANVWKETKCYHRHQESSSGEEPIGSPRLQPQSVTLTELGTIVTCRSHRTNRAATFVLLLPFTLMIITIVTITGSKLN